MINSFQLLSTKRINLRVSLAFASIAAITLLQGCALMNMNGATVDDMDTPFDSSFSAGRRPASVLTEDNSSTTRDGTDPQNAVLSAIARRDILLGMDQQQVMASWGSPREVQTAGMSGSGAERWLYYSVNSLTYGLGKPRIVYFENGHVVGWESR
jgi:hypothetical protein